MTPPVLDHAIRRCLAKDAEERWQTGRDLALELKWIAEARSQSGVPELRVRETKIRERLAWLAAAICALVAAMLGVFHWSTAPEKARIVRSYIKAMPNSSFVVRAQQGGFAISPDGLRLAYVAQNSDGKAMLWVRALDSLQAQALEGTEEASFPFWSPDSHSIGFFASGKLKKIESSGGPSFILCDAPNPRGGSWNQDGVILFARI